MKLRVLYFIFLSLILICYQNCNNLESLNSNVNSLSSELSTNTGNTASAPIDEPENVEDSNDIPIEDPQNIVDQPQLLNCEKVYDDSEITFSWDDKEQNVDTIYDFWLGSTPEGKDIYDHVGNNEFKEDSLFVNNLPVDGRQIYQTLHIYRDGPTDAAPITVSCIATALTREVIPSSKGENYLQIPNHVIGEKAFNQSTWDSLTQLEPIYGQNFDQNSIISYENKWWLQMRHEPSHNGTKRILTKSKLPRSLRGYRLTQTLLFKPGWVAGGTSQSGKLGFSLTGGTPQAGGKTGTDGWSVRPSWSKDEIRFYLYYANRPYLVQGKDPAYGHTLVTGFKYKPGVEYKLTMEVILNSPNKKDGTFNAYINGKLVYSLKNVLWMTGSEPEVDELWTSSFHGGNTEAWSPGKNVYILIRDVHWEEI